MKVKVAYFLLGVLLPSISYGLIFPEDQFKFTNMMQECLKSDGKPLRYILDANNPAMYVSVDNDNEQQQFSGKNSTNYFDCKLQFETELPKYSAIFGEKYDALSLFIIKYHPSQGAFWSQKTASFGLIKRPKVEVITSGHQGYNWMGVNKIADYSKTFWLGKNWRFKHNVLRPGQLTDFGMKVDPEHLVKPEWLHSTFDKPASISISMTLPSTHTVAN